MNKSEDTRIERSKTVCLKKTRGFEILNMVVFKQFNKANNIFVFIPVSQMSVINEEK